MPPLSPLEKYLYLYLIMLIYRCFITVTLAWKSAVLLQITIEKHSKSMCSRMLS